VIIANGTFERISPAKLAERVELPVGWTVLRHDHLPENLQRRETHGKWVAIESGQNKIFRIIRYSASLPKRKIILDWAGWIDLQGRNAKVYDSIPLKVRSPKILEYPIIPFCHVDPGYRMSAWLGLLSVGLGILSLVISLTG
jgi:hypothetical protein